MKRKHHQPAREFGFADEPFTLVAETAQDGARIQAERQAQAAARSDGAKLQPDLFSETVNLNQKAS